ncbi:putative oxygenase [Lachnellula suecica]|uniref:Putative oxygenase n=1 Tax=Lachnellula suecica TaxID=602035 RepID=A0A8T9C223_9HELO|nr:putative oxygenase [Lachnellula suecica]
MAEVPTQQASGPIKFTLTHYRKPEHTHEEFIKWIVEKHLPLAVPVFKRHGIISYSLCSHDIQFVTPPPLNNAMKEQLGKVNPAWDFADFDCFIEYVIPDMGVVGSVMSDPKWLVSVKDQDE